MKCRPIIMGTESVRAILEGRKTQTRRVIKPQPSVSYHWSGDAYEEGGMVKAVLSSKPTIHFDYMPKCRWQVGDRLWVRETFVDEGSFFGALNIRTVKDLEGIESEIMYRADDNDFVWTKDDGTIDFDKKKHRCASHWKSPLYMPRWASRITLEITDIRIERLQDISEEDAKAEGIKVLPLQDESDPSAWYQYSPGIFQARSATKSYELLWNSLNAKRGYPWESNPWVWVISFKKVKE